MRQRPGTVVLDNEAVGALADEHHPKHGAALAILEVTNQRRSRGERVGVVVPVAVRIEAGWDRSSPSAARLNHLSRAEDIGLDAAGANRCAHLGALVPGASVVDTTVAAAAEAAPHPPVTVVTSDAGDLNRLVALLDRAVIVTTL